MAATVKSPDSQSGGFPKVAHFSVLPKVKPSCNMIPLPSLKESKTINLDRKVFLKNYKLLEGNKSARLELV